MALAAWAAVASTAAATPAATETFREIHVQVVGQGRPVLMIPGLNSVGSVFGLGDAGRSVLLHQAVKSGELGLLRLVVTGGAIRRPRGMLHGGLRVRLPKR